MELTGLTEKNKKQIINIVAIIAAFLIAYNLIYKKQALQMESLRSQNSEELKKNEVLKNISGLEKKIAGYKNLLPKKDPIVIINNINNIAREFNIKIDSIRPMPDQKTGEYISTPYSANITVSDYHILGKFISRIENSTEVFIVDNVSIRSQNRESGELSVDMTLSNISFAD